MVEFFLLNKLNNTAVYEYYRKRTEISKAALFILILSAVI